jgi:hypothetical protein
MAMPHNTPQQSDVTSVARALADNAEHVFIAMLGEPSSRSRREYRWGTHGSLAGCLVPPKRGLWNDFESGEGGDLLNLAAGRSDRVCSKPASQRIARLQVRQHVTKLIAELESAASISAQSRTV